MGNARRRGPNNNSSALGDRVPQRRSENMARLIVNPDTPNAWEANLKDGLNTVGRGAANDVVIGDASVSTAHCQMTIAGGSARLKDLGSTNGTFINRQQATEAVLQPGQRFHLGGVEVLFEAEPATQTAAPSAIPQAPPVRVAQPAARLRVSGMQSSAPAVAPPAEAASDAPPLAPPMNMPHNAMCKSHSKVRARWFCLKCQRTFCDLCVTASPGVGGVEQKNCRCGSVCAPMQVTFEAPVAKSFFKELPRSAIYPLRGTGILVLVVATLLFAALEFMGSGLAGLVMKAVALGYLFSYVQNIIHATAAEEENMPELPDMSDVLGGCFRLLGTVGISFGAALVMAYMAFFQEAEWAMTGLIPSILFGCFYFPMAFLVVAMKDTVMGANPLIVVPSICRVPAEYFVTVILLTGVFAVRWAGDLVAGFMGAQSFTTTSMSEMFMTFALRAVWAFLSVYLLTVTVRILGLLYLTKKERLGW